MALLIGTVELLSVLAEKLGLEGGIWSFVATLDLNAVGYVVVGLFVVTWAARARGVALRSRRAALGCAPGPGVRIARD